VNLTGATAPPNQVPEDERAQHQHDLGDAQSSELFGLQPHRAVLEKAHCEGVEFNRCDMDNLRADRSYFGNCTLFPNRAYGIKFRGATLIKLKVSVENGSP
jgi:uncharacterized protein YjbI with pentapeptide repeats